MHKKPHIIIFNPDEMRRGNVKCLHDKSKCSPLENNAWTREREAEFQHIIKSFSGNFVDIF